MRTFLLLLALCFALEVGSAVDLKVGVKGKASEITKIMGITPGVEKILNSPEFKSRILSSTFKDTKDSSEDIYRKLTLSTWDLHYEFKMQRNWRGKCPVLGWTYPTVKTVWFNSCNFMGRSDSGIAGTVCHEQAHKLGYSHRSAYSLNSVPYALGTICAELYGKIRPANLAVH